MDNDSAAYAVDHPLHRGSALDRDAGGVAPELELDAVFAWGDPLHPGSYYFTHSEESAKAAHREGLNVRRFELADWPFLDDPPDPL